MAGTAQGTPNRRATTAMDFRIGAILRRMRTDREWSQQRLAEEAGITFQQVQKYEKGANRVACSRMITIAGLLGSTASAVMAEAEGLLERAEAAAKAQPKRESKAKRAPRASAKRKKAPARRTRARTGVSIAPAKKRRA